MKNKVVYIYAVCDNGKSNVSFARKGIDDRVYKKVSMSSMLRLREAIRGWVVSPHLYSHRMSIFAYPR